MSRHRTDMPHAAIRDGLRDVTSCIDWSQTECGADLVAPHRATRAPVFLEVKPAGSPSARRLTPSEQRLQRVFPGSYHVVSTLSEALAALGYSVPR